MSNHRKSQDPEKQVSTKEEVEKFNERPYWNDRNNEFNQVLTGDFERIGEAGEKISFGTMTVIGDAVPTREVFDTLKKETNIDTESLKVERLDVYSYLTDRAKYLHDYKLYSTVEEYWHDPRTQDRWKVSDPTDPEWVAWRAACERGEAFEGDPRALVEPQKFVDERAALGVERKTFLVAYFGVTVMTDDGTITEEVKKRFADLLNQLAEKNIWWFGTFMCPLSIPLGVFNDGTPMMSCLPGTGPFDPKDLSTYFKRNEGEGRRVMLLAYIGVHPTYQERYNGVCMKDHCHNDGFRADNPLHVAADGITESDIPLDTKHTIFIDEGALPLIVWDGIKK